MEDLSNVSDRPKEVMQKKKKKRGGTRFSNSKALKRSAMRKRGESSSNGDEPEADPFDIFYDHDVPLEFRQTVRMRSLNLEAVGEDVETDEVEEVEELKDMIEDHGSTKQSPTSSESLDCYIGDDGGAVETNTQVCDSLQYMANVIYLPMFIKFIL